MDAVAKLKELYEMRDKANEQIQAIEQLLGAEPLEVKKKAIKCSNCNQEGHTARTCPTKLPINLLGGERA